ncbi:hypothetical protein VTK73DRAFT_4543 [Phialemonium thermophilum]|uniref:Uncharacterized protein n=1 Tax=Phialemonium thermophilum TaxID=223376 RepID=A0ABR3WSU5_9PEZI
MGKTRLRYAYDGNERSASGAARGKQTMFVKSDRFKRKQNERDGEVTERNVNWKREERKRDNEKFQYHVISETKQTIPWWRPRIEAVPL